LIAEGRNWGSFAPILAAAVASPLVGVIALILTGRIGLPTGPDVPLQIGVFLSILFFWAPAFALAPSAILGFLVERPLARRLIANREGGFFEHLLAVIGAALLLWLLLRVVVVLMGPQTKIVDGLSLAMFAIVGLCSALSWWIFVIAPGRRAGGQEG